MDRDVFHSLQYSFNNVWNEVVNFLPEIVTAIVVLIVGWIIGAVLQGVVERVFKALRLDEALDKAGVDTLSERAGLKFRPAYFVGALVKWFVIIVFIVVALDILHLQEVSAFFSGEVLQYLPKVVAAALILMGAIVLSNVASGAIEAGVRASGFGSADLIGAFARYALLVFGVLAALSELEIASDMIQILFSGIVFGAALAFGLAFGLGGRETASRYLGKLEGEVKGTHSSSHSSM